MSGPGPTTNVSHECANSPTTNGGHECTNGVAALHARIGAFGAAPAIRGRWGFGFAALLLIIAACGAAGDPARGEALFDAQPAGGGMPCAECHSLSPGMASPLGPSLAGVGARAGEAVPGQPAADYLRESILSPDAHLAAGFQEGIMPRTYDQTLGDGEVADLVAYLLTLR